MFVRSARYAAAAVVAAVAVTAAALLGTSQRPAQAAPAQLKLVNYYPSMNAQGLFWNPWNPAAIDGDFAVIANSLHANAVRIFVPTQQFGWPAPLNATYTAELSQLVGIAAAHGLGVYLNLFNYYVPYTDVPDSKAWARALLAPYAGDPRIVAVEVQNEINPYNTSAIAWAKAVIPFVRQIDGGIPVGISVCGCNFFGDLKDLHTYLGSSQPNFYDFHYYPDPNADPTPSEAENISEATIQWVLTGAKNIVAPAGLVVGETGMSTFYPDATNSPSATSDPQWEQVQADYYGKVEQAAQLSGLAPAAPWDYVDVGYGGGVWDTSQRFFGIFRMDGSPKPAAAVIAQAFAAA
jgi:cellulase (glycosyl hydrolase family 5)